MDRSGIIVNISYMSKQDAKNPAIAIGIWIGVFVLTVAVVVGLVLVNQKNGGQNSASKTDTLSVDVGPADHVRGNPMSRIVLVEYSDFQCPACGAYYPLVKKLEGEYDNRMQVVYRNFPLTQLHKSAYLAAQFAEAAGKQGKFFEMHDLLFEHQSEWPELANVKEKLLTYVDTLKLDRTVFEKDLESKDVKDKIENDVKSGDSSNVQGTPTFFLNGKKMESPRSYEELKQSIDSALDNSK